MGISHNARHLLLCKLSQKVSEIWKCHNSYLREKHSKESKKKGGVVVVTAILVLTTVICGIGWIANKISMLAVLKYLADKQVPLPSDQEIHQCTTYVVRRLFGLKDQNGL